MSVEPTTPMSIDKSTVDAEPVSKSVIRNDRDRFFEVLEYQKDILKYLKQLEVRRTILCWPFRLNSSFHFADSEKYSSSRRVHEETARHQRLDALDSSRLACWGQRRVSFARRNALPRCQLHRSFLELHVRRPCKTPAGGDGSNVHRLVSISSLWSWTKGC